MLQSASMEGEPSSLEPQTLDLLGRTVSVHIEVSCEANLEQAIRALILQSMCEAALQREFFVRDAKLYSISFPDDPLKAWECHINSITDHNDHFCITGFVRVVFETGEEKVIAEGTGFSLDKEESILSGLLN